MKDFTTAYTKMNAYVDAVWNVYIPCPKCTRNHNPRIEADNGRKDILCGCGAMLHAELAMFGGYVFLRVVN